MTLTQARCCRLLGVSATATADETRAAYRRLARRMHPDRVGGDGERFKEITAAYNWLIARQTGRIIDPPRKTKRRRASTSRGHYRHRARETEGDDGAEHRAQSDEAADFWKTWQRRRAEFERDRAGRTAPPRREQRAEQQAEQRAEQQADQQANPHAEPAAPRREAGPAAPPRDDMHAAREARRRARAARRKVWEDERAETESPWDEEFAEAWASWCKTAERFHSAQARRRDGTASTDADSAEPSEAETPDAKPWRPARSEAPADKPSLFRRVKSRVAELRRKTALDRVGEDISLRLPVDIDLLLNGGTRNIAVNRAAACPSCLGRDATCATCDGAGRVKLRETVRVSVPRGARPGARLRLEGKGSAGLDGAPDGDLYLLLEPEEITGFTRDDLDLRGKVTLSDRLARAGGKVEVALPRGSVKLAVPANTRPGDTFRLRGQGLPAWRGGEVGDLFLTVAIR